MTDTKKLRNLIEKKGLKYKFIADELNLSTYGLKLKIENDNEFKVSEVDKLSNILGLSIKAKDSIFLPSK